MGFSDFSFSVQMRDTMERIAASAVERLRPRDRYGIVSTVDYTTGKASVTLNGDSNPVQINMGNNIPTIGQTVRVSGTSGDKFISGVVGGETPAASAMRLRINYFSASESPLSYPQGVSTMDVNSTAGWPGTGFIVTYKINENRIRQYFYSVSASNWSGLTRYAHVNAITFNPPWSPWEAVQTKWKQDDVSVSRAMTAGNWYRIATMPGTDAAGTSLAFADFVLTTSQSGIHEVLRFSAGLGYSGAGNAALNLQDYTHYSSSPAFSAARIVAPSGTYGPLYLEIKCARTCSVVIRIKHVEWDATDGTTAGNYRGAWTPAYTGRGTADHPTGEMVSIGLWGTNDWTSLALINGWTNYGGGYEIAEFCMLPGSLVVLKGLVGGGTVGTNTITSAVTILPDGCKPSGRKMFGCMGGGNAMARVDVVPEGNVAVIAATSNSFVTLDNIRFPAIQ